MRTSNLTLALALVAFCAAPVAAQESPTLKKIKDTGTITIGHRDSSIPFSYYDDKQNVVGYALDICLKVVDAVKAELKMPNLQVKLNPVTSATRIPLIANGTVDLECGSTTNNLARQKDVSFADTTFVEEIRMAVKADSGIKSVTDLKGKTVATTTGTTSVQTLRRNKKAEGIDFKELFGKDHSDSFLLVESGRADAFVMDGSLLAGLIARSKNPKDFKIVGEALSIEPIAIMVRKDDEAFRKIINQTIAEMTKSGEIYKLYDKWFMQPTPPTGAVVNLPMSDNLKEALKHPNDKPMEDYAKKITG